MSTLRILRVGVAALLVLLAIVAIQDADALRKGRQDAGTPVTRVQTPAAESVPPAARDERNPAGPHMEPRRHADKLV